MGQEQQRGLILHEEHGALGSWRVFMRPPAADLGHCVDLLWLGEGRVNYLADRILPTGCSHLLINLGPVQYLLDPAAERGRRAFRRIWLSGPHDRPIDTSAPHGQCLLGVAFKPGGLHAWLRPDTHALSGQVLDLEDVLGVETASLHESLCHLDGPAARIDFVERWLRTRMHRRLHADTSWALHLIARSHGQRSIDSIQRELGCSRNHLATLFRRQVGLSPKSLARLCRFNDALGLLRGRQQVPWVELAQHCGYYDQSHLTRDFQSFSGFAPGEFVRHAQPDAGSIVIR
ncbi:MAG: helix-turn-helix transcriptional regulator [Xanthomonadales bacterium]|nr:helix-turn-helix transcriptional regulator [Xanthomonadales bacterium]